MDAPTVAELQMQHEALQFDSFTADDAVAIGVIATTIAVERSLPVVIELRIGERMVYRAALEGTSGDNDEWLRRKFAVVHRFERSSLAMRRQFEEQGTDFYAATGLPESDHAAFGGGWPITVRGLGLVGVMGVSGLPHVQDHALIVEAISTFIDGS